MTIEQEKEIKKYKKVIGTNIKTFREIKGLTQQQLADELSIKVDKLKDIERGKSELKAEKIIYLAKEYGVFPNYFYGLSDVMYYDTSISVASTELGLNDFSIFRLNNIKKESNSKVLSDKGLNFINDVIRTCFLENLSSFAESYIKAKKILDGKVKTKYSKNPTEEFNQTLFNLALKLEQEKEIRRILFDVSESARQFFEMLYKLEVERESKQGGKDNGKKQKS